MPFREQEVLSLATKLLNENMNPSEVLKFLESNGTITHQDSLSIRDEKPNEQNQALIDCLYRKERFLDRFLFVLIETGQGHIVEKINEFLQEVGLELIDIEATKNAILHEIRDHHQPAKLRSIALCIKKSTVPYDKASSNFIQDLSCVQKMLKKIYLSSFKAINPISLPFTFDIENTWVSLALEKDDSEDDDSTFATEDHAVLLNRVFTKVKMLIIEGKPATGKTSLMRRIAYDWAKQINALKHYDIVIYAEFRRVREQQYKTIADLVIGHLDSLSRKKKTTEISRLINNDEFLEKHRVLVLLDGYDESSLNREQCEELHDFLNLPTSYEPLMFNIVLTTRPGHLSMYKGQKGRFVFADVIGFPTHEQKRKYILNHFSAFKTDQTSNIQSVHSLLESHAQLCKLAETPLFLTFICLLHKQIQNGTLLELYCKTVCWLLDRYQKDFPNYDVPLLFGYKLKKETDIDKFQIIQDFFYEFPQLHILGNMAMHHEEKSEFSLSDIELFKIESIVQKVGLLSRYEIRDASYMRRTEYCFPHRTIQEFLAAFAYFFSTGKETDTIIDEFIKKQNSLCNSQEKEVEKFLWRIASSEMPITTIRRSAFFERFEHIVNLNLGIFISSKGYNARLLNVCFEKMPNVARLNLEPMSDSVLIFSEAIDFTKMTRLNYIKFHGGSNSAVSFKDIPHNSQLPAPDPTHGLRPESFALMTENINSIKLFYVTFKSGKLFVKSMKYLLTLLKPECTVFLRSVKVQSNDEPNSTFTVDTGIENISAFSPLKIVLEVFSDPDLNEALQYISCACRLFIDNSGKAVDVNTFVDFPNLERCDLNGSNFIENIMPAGPGKLHVRGC